MFLEKVWKWAKLFCKKFILRILLACQTKPDTEVGNFPSKRRKLVFLLFKIFFLLFEACRASIAAESHRTNCVCIRTTELSRHTLQFAPLPVFSGRFGFAPFGAFYYWRKLVLTPVLYGADVSRFANLFTIACHVKRLKIFRILGRIVRNTSPWATWLSRELPHHRIFLFSFFCLRRGCFLSSPADFPFAGAELSLPVRSGTSCFRTRVFLPRIFPYAAASPFLRQFPPPAPAGSVFSCGLIRCQFAVSHSSIWTRSAVRQATIFLPAFCTSSWRVPCQHSCWSSLRYVILVVPVLVGWFDDFIVDHCHIVLSSRFHISYTVCRKFFSSSSEFRFVRLQDRVSQFFHVAFWNFREFRFRFHSDADRSDSDPVWIRFTRNCSISSSHSMFTR